MSRKEIVDIQKSLIFMEEKGWIRVHELIISSDYIYGELNRLCENRKVKDK